MNIEHNEYRTNMKTVPDWDADIVITFPCDAKETTVLWFKQKIESIPGIILHTTSLTMSGNLNKKMALTCSKCYAFYIKATYECYLRGLEQMHIPKPLKEDQGGGTKEFIFNDKCCYKDVENFEIFLTSQERQSILLFLLNRLRAQEGIHYLTKYPHKYILYFNFQYHFLVK